MPCLLRQASFCSVPPNTVLQILMPKLVSLHTDTLGYLDLSPLPVKSYIAPSSILHTTLYSWKISSSSFHCSYVLYGILKVLGSYVRGKETGHFRTLCPNVVLLSDHDKTSKILFVDKSAKHAFDTLSPLQKLHYLLLKCQPNNMK